MMGVRALHSHMLSEKQEIWINADKKESESYHQLYLSADATINMSAQGMSAITSSKTGLIQFI